MPIELPPRNRDNFALSALVRLTPKRLDVDYTAPHSQLRNSCAAHGMLRPS